MYYDRDLQSIIRSSSEEEYFPQARLQLQTSNSWRGKGFQDILPRREILLCFGHSMAEGEELMA